MSDLITLFKKDVFNLIDDLENKKIIDNIKKNSISIDYASKSKQGDLSTNILLVLFKNNLEQDVDMKKYISSYLLNLQYLMIIHRYVCNKEPKPKELVLLSIPSHETVHFLLGHF